MKRIISNKYFIVILVLIITSVFVGFEIIKSKQLEKEYHNNIVETITVGEKYNNEKSDANRSKFIKRLKELVVIYAEIRDREDGDRSYDAKWLCDLLSSSYDILEVDKNQANELNSLLEGLQNLESDLYDESGMANIHFQNFIKANK